MAARVTLSVQASEDQQNTSFKHLETVSLLLFTLNCMFTLRYVYTLRLIVPISYLGACYIYTKVTKCIREKIPLSHCG